MVDDPGPSEKAGAFLAEAFALLDSSPTLLAAAATLHSGDGPVTVATTGGPVTVRLARRWLRRSTLTMQWGDRSGGG